MIRFATKETRAAVREMWDISFGDGAEYTDIYFAHKYKDEDTLIYFIDNRPVASLQMLPYRIRFYGKEIPFSYISGACTLPQYRKCGCMDALLKKAFEVMRDRNIPLSILIPGEEWLYEFYEKYGYETVFEENDDPIDIGSILKQNEGDLDKAYIMYKTIYQNKDFCVLHDRTDFEIIVEQAKLDDYPLKTDLDGMAKIIDAAFLLSLFAARYPAKKIVVSLGDQQGNYQIQDGRCTLTKAKADMIVNNQLMCRLLFGFYLEDLDTVYTSSFESHQPSISLMLE